MNARGRDHDIVLVGATGFVGRFTAEHLARTAPPDVRIAIAGRSRPRLEALTRDLGVDWPVIEVDTSDGAGVARLAASTAVVATTVGPYLRYGVALVAACARAGTSYADLAGESVFVARSVTENHAVAGASGARIVHSCGFDSIPSDLGVGLGHAAAAAGPIAAAVLRVRSASGGVSGGTIDSLRTQAEEAGRDEAARRLVGDPYAFTPGVARPAPFGQGGRWERDPASGSWQAPFVMGAYNQQIVQRSNYLTDWGYGQLMQYREVVMTGPGPRGAAAAAGLVAGTALLMGGMSVRPTRAILDRVLPAPGSGPSADVIARGRLALDVDVHPVDGDPVRTRIEAPFDPGYGGTGVMLGQTALSLALDDLPPHAGVLTPWVALGDALADRLRAQRFTIKTEALV